MAKELVRTVVVDGTVYAPGDDVPADVAEQITNPAAWESEDEPTPAERVQAAEDAALEAQQARVAAAEADAEPAKPAARSSAARKG